MTPIGTPENLSFLKTVSILEDLEDAELRELAAHFELMRFDFGHKILREGEANSQFFILKSGTVNVTRGPEGREIFIAALKPGDYFGEAALFHDAKRIANVKANDPVEAFVIDKKSFREFLRTHGVAANKILFMMLRQIFLRLEVTTQELQFERNDLHGKLLLDKLFN